MPFHRLRWCHFDFSMFCLFHACRVYRLFRWWCLITLFISCVWCLLFCLMFYWYADAWCDDDATRHACLLISTRWRDYFARALLYEARAAITMPRVTFNVSKDAIWYDAACRADDARSAPLFADVFMLLRWLWYYFIIDYVISSIRRHFVIHVIYFRRHSLFSLRHFSAVITSFFFFFFFFVSADYWWLLFLMMLRLTPYFHYWYARVREICASAAMILPSLLFDVDAAYGAPRHATFDVVDADIIIWLMMRFAIIWLYARAEAVIIIDAAAAHDAMLSRCDDFDDECAMPDCLLPTYFPSSFISSIIFIVILLHFDIISPFFLLRHLPSLLIFSFSFYFHTIISFHFFFIFIIFSFYATITIIAILFIVYDDDYYLRYSSLSTMPLLLIILLFWYDFIDFAVISRDERDAIITCWCDVFAPRVYAWCRLMMPRLRRDYFDDTLLMPLIAPRADDARWCPFFWLLFSSADDIYVIFDIFFVAWFFFVVVAWCW